MGVVLRSGYSQVPLAPESTLAILAMITTNEIQAQRQDTVKSIFTVLKNTQILVDKRKRSWSQMKSFLTNTFSEAETF